MNALYGLSITANKKAVLDTLRKNRAEHAKIVAEARTAYAEKAKAALEKKLEAFKVGKIVSLAFKLTGPQDYTTVYDTAIRALEMHTGENIELGSEQVRNLLEDNWDWSSQFTSSNMLYSDTLKKKFQNYDPEDEE
jgi:hypothetical protein